MACALVFALANIACASHGRAEDAVVISTRTVPRFADLRLQLQAMVNSLGFHIVNQICVIAYQIPGNRFPSGAYIYWPTQHTLIDWDYGSEIIYAGTYFYDLNRDVIADDAYPGSQYPRQSFVNGVIHDCIRHGDNYTIIRTSGKWVPIKKFSQFSTIEDQLQYLVDHDGAARRNNFCVLGQKDGPFLGAYIYWKTAAKLIIWLPGPYDVYDPFAVADMPVQIDLERGLRDHEDADDYRDEMQRSYAESILKSCEDSGENFTVEKSD